jgi:hypothetical protein
VLAADIILPEKTNERNRGSSLTKTKRPRNNNTLSKTEYRLNKEQKGVAAATFPARRILRALLPSGVRRQPSPLDTVQNFVSWTVDYVEATLGWSTDFLTKNNGQRRQKTDSAPLKWVHLRAYVLRCRSFREL